MEFYDSEHNIQVSSLKSPDVLYEEIKELVSSSSSLKEAIGALEMFLAMWPNYALAHNDLGVLYYKDGNKEKSLQCYEKAADLQPGNITFQKNLADFYYVELNQVEAAMALYVKVLSINPEDIETLLTLGHICVAVEQFDDAKGFYDRVLNIAPGHEGARKAIDKISRSDRNERNFVYKGEPFRQLPMGKTEEILDVAITPILGSVRSAWQDLKAYEIKDVGEGHQAILDIFSIIMKRKLNIDICSVPDQIWDRLLVIDADCLLIDRKTDRHFADFPQNEREAVLPKRFSGWVPSRLRDIQRLAKIPPENLPAPLYASSGIFRKLGADTNSSIVYMMDGARRLMAAATMGTRSVKVKLILLPEEYAALIKKDVKLQIQEKIKSLRWFQAYQCIDVVGIRGRRSFARMNLIDHSKFRNKSILDFGCNLGQMSVSSAQAGASRVLGIDGMADTLEVTKAIQSLVGLPNLDYALIDFNSPNFDTDIDALFPGQAHYTFFFSVYRTKELTQRDRLFNYVLDKAKIGCYFEGHADPVIDTNDYYVKLFSRFGVKGTLLGFGEKNLRPVYYIDVSGRKGSDDKWLSINGDCSKQKDVKPKDMNRPNSDKYIISAIVSTYNAARFIRGCIENLEVQTIAKEMEIVIVNSGSEEDEETIVRDLRKKYDNIKYIKTKDRETVYQAWNRGIKASSGKYVTNANTDDRRYVDSIENLVNVLEENPELVLAYGDFDVTDTENCTPENANILEKMVYPAYKRGTLLSSCYPGPMPVWRKGIHDEFGYFNESFVSAGDREFWCRISQKYPMLHVKKHMGVYYRNPEGIANSNKRNGIVQQEAERIAGRYAKSFQVPWDKFQRIDFHVEENFPETKKALQQLERSGGGFHIHVQISRCKLEEYLWLQQKRDEGLIHELSLTQEGQQKFPSVAILMFTYDRLEYTREAMHNLMRNTRYPFDLYIVDNHSTDGTREWLEAVRLEYPDRIKDIRYNSTNEGLPGPTNDFWNRVDVDLVGKVDNDTLVPSGWLERLVEAHQKVPKLAVVGGYHFRPEDFDEEAAQDNLYAENDIQILQDTHIGGCAYLMKKSIQQQFGPMNYNPALKIHGWTEYQIRMVTGGYIVGYLYPLIQLEYMDDPRSKKCLINEKYRDYAREIWKERGINFQSTEQLVGWITSDAQRVTSGTYKNHFFPPNESTQTTRQNQFISIVILTHNQIEYTKKCIESIYKCTKGPFELIVVDNGSTDGTVAYLETEVGGYRTEVRIIKNEENLGFAAGNNQGMAAAKGDYILLMNNDIVVTSGWLERLVSCAERGPRIGIVGPMSNYVSGPQLVKNVTYNITELDGLDDFADGFSKKYAGKTERILRVVGFCMLIKRSVINKIGGMDGRYGLGNFEDDDFSLRATLAGFESWIAEDCFLHHFGNRTFMGAKIDYHESLHKNWEIFKEKWGMPKDIPYGSYDVSDILKKGFIPKEHYCPLPGTRVSAVSEVECVPENDDHIMPELVFKKKSKPGMVSIIIPVAGHLKHLKKCIANVKKNTPEAHEIIFVENGCKAGTLKWIKQRVKRKSNHRLIKTGKETGPGKCFNRGIEASSGEYIILLRGHVLVADGWLGGMLKCINSANDIGIVGPMTSAKTAGIQCMADSDHLKIGQLEEYARAFREKYRCRRIPSHEIMSFCMIFRRSLVEEIGAFDEELEWGAANDYCLRAALEGYRNSIAGDVFVLCGALPPKGNRRFFDHKWRNVDAKSYYGERLGVHNAITDAEKLYQREEVDKAIATLIDGITYRPGEEAIYHRLAEMLIDRERFKEAHDAINSIPEDKEDSVRTLELTGYAKAGLEQYDEAEQFADRVLSLNGVSAPALNLLGVLAHGRGDKNASEDFFKRAVASDPGYGAAYTNLGVLAWEDGCKESALETLEKGFILSPTVEDNRTAYLSAVSETAEFERAEGVFREAKKLYPQNRPIALLLIDILIRQEKYDSAMQDIHKAMITFGVDDGILSAAQSVLDRFDAEETKDMEEKPGLSLCMIVKDEEDCLARCLLSAVPVVDEIVIVDTGSTDRTTEIAKAFGAKVYDFEWIDDFSEARNLSLSKATGEWILVLDADETISPLDYDRLNKIVKNNAVYPMAYSITTRNYVKPTYAVGWTCNDGEYPDEEGGTGWYPSEKVRLFTNDSRIRFENPVHEFVESSLKRNGIKIRICDIPVHHYGQLDRGNYIAKGDKYYQLGVKKLAEKGENLESLTELAVQCGGEFGKYEEALDLWKRVLEIDPGNIKALVNMGVVCLELERYEAAHTSLKMAIALDPDLKEAIVIYTTCEMLIGDAGKTIPTLEGLLKKVPGYPMALAILAAAYCVEGERKKGLKHIKRLTKMGFECAHYLHDLSERLVSTGKTERAVSLLESAVESGNGTREIRSLLSELEGEG